MPTTAEQVMTTGATGTTETGPAPATPARRTPPNGDGRPEWAGGGAVTPSPGAAPVEAATSGLRPGREVQAEARELYRRSVAEGQPLTGAALGERLDRTDRWGRMQIAAVRAEQ